MTSREAGTSPVLHVLFHWIPGGGQEGRGRFCDVAARPVSALSLLASGAARGGRGAGPSGRGERGRRGWGRCAHAQRSRFRFCLGAAVTGRSGRRPQPLRGLVWAWPVSGQLLCRWPGRGGEAVSPLPQAVRSPVPQRVGSAGGGAVGVASGGKCRQPPRWRTAEERAGRAARGGCAAWQCRSRGVAGPPRDLKARECGSVQGTGPQQ